MNRFASCCRDVSVYTRREQKENTSLSRHRIVELISLHGGSLHHLGVQTGEHKTFLHYAEELFKQANDLRLAF
jgi:aminoglycoside N3'-acetyltransferase